MATKNEVDRYLDELKTKTRIFGILILDERSKNAQALHSLDITPDTRKEIILGLKTEDYTQGPLDVTYYDQFDMWVFGKTINKVELYIKVCITTRNVICISFHEAEFPMNHPFKKRSELC